MSRTLAPPQPAHTRRLSGRGRYVLIRVTGVLLAVLALGHFALTHIVTDVADTNSNFVARRWSSALWVTWDGLLLGTTLLHAFAGLSTIIRDYQPTAQSGRRWTLAMLGLTAVLLVVGLAALTFSVIG